MLYGVGLGRNISKGRWYTVLVDLRVQGSRYCGCDGRQFDAYVEGQVFRMYLEVTHSFVVFATSKCLRQYASLTDESWKKIFRVGALQGYRQTGGTHGGSRSMCESGTAVRSEEVWGCLLTLAGEEVGFGKKHLGIQK